MLNNKLLVINKYFFVFLIMLMSNVSFAHQPDLSSIIISKTENGKFVLQINSSLTAFQQEVNYINGVGAYKTPEEFRNLVIKHFNTTFSIILNGKDTLTFVNPTVILGHETKIVAEIIGLPKNINAIYLKNELFKDIHNNQSVVMFSLEGFPTKINYELNNDNKHELNIILKDGNWQKVEKFDYAVYLKYALYTLAFFLVSFLIYFIIKKVKKTNPQ